MLVNRIFAVLVFFILIGTNVIFAILRELSIFPKINNTLFSIVAVLSSMILTGLILHYPYLYFSKKYPKQYLGNISREIIAECNSLLMNYYKIPEDYIISKCYDSSNQLLQDKDLILYFYRCKLRIVNDFTNTIKDFGCYEVTLVLGKRAKPYIFRNFEKEHQI